MIVHGLRSACHIHAYTTFGFVGSISIAAAPAVSEMCSTCFHVSPPSVVLYTPRVAFALNGSPCTAAYTTFAFVGSIRSVAICPASFNPIHFHVLPASVDLY